MESSSLPAPHIQLSINYHSQWPSLSISLLFIAHRWEITQNRKEDLETDGWPIVFVKKNLSIFFWDISIEKDLFRTWAL